MSRFKRGGIKQNNVVPMNDQSRQIMTLASTMVSRAQMAASLGSSYGGERDLYTALGYNKTPTFSDYYAKYDRQDIARRIVKAPVDSAWRKKPLITEQGEDESAFDKAWADLVKNTNMYHYMARVDRLSGIGEYGVLLLGIGDGQDDLKQPVGKGKELLYMRPYSENNAEIITWVTDVTDPRYGQPEMYRLKPSNADRSKVSSVDVHWTRCVHVAEGTEEDDVYGTPRLKCVYNRLQDLETVTGGSAEMFWRGAFPGLGFMADSDAAWDPQVLDDMRTEVENYMHGLQRYLRLKGVSIDQLAAQVADPRGHVDILLDLIAGATGIPKRILIGSERGELASSQDENNWNSRVDERRDDHVEPMIIRPVVDKLIEVGIVPPPSDQYTVEWPDIISPDEVDEAEVALKKTEALAKYASSPGVDILMPPEFYLKKVLGYTQDDIDQMQDQAQSLFEEERRQISEEAAAVAEEADFIRKQGSKLKQKEFDIE